MENVSEAFKIGKQNGPDGIQPQYNGTCIKWTLAEIHKSYLLQIACIINITLYVSIVWCATLVSCKQSVAVIVIV